MVAEIKDEPYVVFVCDASDEWWSHLVQTGQIATGFEVTIPNSRIVSKGQFFF